MSTVHFEFDMGAVHLTVFSKDFRGRGKSESRMLLRTETSSHEWCTFIALPTPGYFDTTTSNSTYDTRGTILAAFTIKEKTCRRSIVEVKTCKESEDWVYGSLDESWGHREPENNVYYLVVAMDPETGVLVDVCSSIREAERL